MNIVVCIKQVPDTTDVKIDKKTNTLDRAGIEAQKSFCPTKAYYTVFRLILSRDVKPR